MQSSGKSSRRFARSHLVARCAATIALAGAVLQGQAAHAANWFELQGIANPAWGKAHASAWIEPAYTRFDTAEATNHHVPTSDLVGPDFARSEALTVQRARLALRGRLNRHVDYFVSGEFGDNAFTRGGSGYAPRLYDAHVMLSHYLRGVRIEAGLIRAPGPEDAMSGYMGYAFFAQLPTVIGQLMQPTFYARSQHYVQVGSGYLVPEAAMSSNNGFHYPGVEATDWFKVRPDVELSYGVMLGEYGKVFTADTGNGPIAAARVQASWLLGGRKGPYRNDLTAFVWRQQARPSINGVSHALRRDGLGIVLRRGFMVPGATSLKLEYMEGRGTIIAPPPFQPATGLLPAQQESTVYASSSNQARGYYVSAGVFLNRRVELDARYDYYDRLPDLAAAERTFSTTGLGVQYHFTPLTRVAVDYFVRRVRIPNPAAIGAAGSPALNLASSAVAAAGNELNVYAVIAF